MKFILYAHGVLKNHACEAIPVQTLENKEDLINAFEWMKQKEARIRVQLKEIMPEYIERAWQAGEKVEKQELQNA